MLIAKRITSEGLPHSADARSLVQAIHENSNAQRDVHQNLIGQVSLFRDGQVPHDLSKAAGTRLLRSPSHRAQPVFFGPHGIGAGVEAVTAPDERECEKDALFRGNIRYREIAHLSRPGLPTDRLAR